MLTLLNLVIFVAIIIAIFLCIKYYTSKNKSHCEKSSSEKIATTLGRKFNREVDKIAEGIRNPEELRKELIEILDNSFKELQNASKKHAEGILTVKENTINILEETRSKLPESERKAKDYKTKYLQSDPKDETLLNLANRYVTQLIVQEQMIDSCNKKLENCEFKLEDIKFNFDSAKSKLNNKKLEIYESIFDSGNSYKIITQNINDIHNEFKEIIQKKNITIEANDLISGEPESKEQIVNLEAIKNKFDSL